MLDHPGPFSEAHGGPILAQNSTKNGPLWPKMALHDPKCLCMTPNGPKTLPMGILHDIVSCWTTLGPFQRPIGVIKASAGSNMSYNHVLCPWEMFIGHFGSCRYILGHEGTFSVMKALLWSIILGHKGTFWCCFGPFGTPVGLSIDYRVVQHDIRIVVREKKRDYVGKIPKLRGGSDPNPLLDVYLPGIQETHKAPSWVQFCSWYTSVTSPKTCAQTPWCTSTTRKWNKGWFQKKRLKNCNKNWLSSINGQKPTIWNSTKGNLKWWGMEKTKH